MDRKSESAGKDKKKHVRSRGVRRGVREAGSSDGKPNGRHYGTRQGKRRLENPKSPSAVESGKRRNS